MHLYRQKNGLRRALIVSGCAFALTLVVALALLNGAGDRVRDEQLTILQDALRRAAVTCYALEGRYPPTLEYLTERYAVVVDEERFAVYYDVFAKNFMPSIEVSPIGGEESNAI